MLSLRHKSSERGSSGLFALEGWRELGHCLSAGLTVEALFFCPEALPEGHSVDSLPLPQGVRLFQVSPAVYERIAYRGGTEGVVALVRQVRLSLSDLRLRPSPLVVVLERVEKPGNLGAVLRSADASGADAVIVCDPLGDLYNPNVVRSSLGSVFTVPCVVCRSQECIAFLRERGLAILTAQLQDSQLYYGTDMRRPVAIVLGSEAGGLSPLWREAADAHVRIPMLGSLDSLNVSVSAAILLYEAVRQRRGGVSL